jgi:hypothetical protein
MIGCKRDLDKGLGLDTADLHWVDVHSSQEELRAKHDGILVSTTVMHEQDSIDAFERA